MLFQNLLLCMAALLMLLSATLEFLAPGDYRLSERGAVSRCGPNRFELAWRDVRRALLYHDGVRLSPLGRASRLDAFRGVYLRFAQDGQAGDRESVLASLASLRLQADAPHPPKGES
jgi:hypothetical protein